MPAFIKTFANPDKQNRLIKLKTRRKTWLDIHLWLGLLLGLFMAIYGLTGSILVFYSEINELLNIELMTVTAPGENAHYKSINQLTEAAKASMPEQAKPTFATYPRNAEAAFRFRYSLPLAKNVTQIWEVFVNPYTAQVTGKLLMSASDNFFPSTFIGIVFELHYALLLGEDPGYLLVSAIASFLLISLLSGLILWWPLTGKWLKALTLKRKASLERLNYDLHKTFGFYSSIVLIPVLFSGIYMDVPQHIVPVLEFFSPVTYRSWFKSTPSSDKQSLTLAEAISIADKRYVEGRADWLKIPYTPDGTFTVCKNGIDEPGSLLNRRCVVIDRYSGKLLDVDDPVTGTAGEVFTHWQWPLHSGQALGWTGRIMVFLSGLACPLLFVTGVIRWLQKRQAREARDGIRRKT
jgi:uncharacterized iron-regulated membrane protein